jgi:hypothetical protein
MSTTKYSYLDKDPWCPRCGSELHDELDCHLDYYGSDKYNQDDSRYEEILDPAKLITTMVPCRCNPQEIIDKKIYCGCERQHLLHPAKDWLILHYMKIHWDLSCALTHLVCNVNAPMDYNSLRFDVESLRDKNRHLERDLEERHRECVRRGQELNALRTEHMATEQYLTVLAQMFLKHAWHTDDCLMMQLAEAGRMAKKEHCTCQLEEKKDGARKSAFK